ncbi:helix-turn-helix domain-containing protein [Actinomycetes bacterium M1A6_2h]
MTSTVDAQAARLGQQIRQLRRSHGMTLVQLANAADLTHSFLSQLERGLTRPSMASLERIARALGSTQPALMAAAAEPAINESVNAATRLVRASEGTAVATTGGQARMLVGIDSAFHPMEYSGVDTLPGHFFSHAEDEFLYVAEGSVVIDLDSEGTFELGAGDSLYYRGGTRHRWWASTATGYRLVVVKQRL